jgi:hypothetical protein
MFQRFINIFSYTTKYLAVLEIILSYWKIFLSTEQNISFNDKIFANTTNYLPR